MLEVRTRPCHSVSLKRQNLPPSKVLLGLETSRLHLEEDSWCDNASLKSSYSSCIFYSLSIFVLPPHPGLDYVYFANLYSVYVLHQPLGANRWTKSKCENEKNGQGRGKLANQLWASEGSQDCQGPSGPRSHRKQEAIWINTDVSIWCWGRRRPGRNFREEIL